MSVLLITHDLGVVANVADEVVVMYRGRVMEAGSREDIFRNAQHPYLQALMRAVPRFAMAEDERLTPIREVKSASLATADAPERVQPTGPILKAEHLTKCFTLRSGWFSGKTRDDPRRERGRPRPSRRHRRWASWANPAAARPPCPR